MPLDNVIDVAKMPSARQMQGNIPVNEASALAMRLAEKHHVCLVKCHRNKKIYKNQTPMGDPLAMLEKFIEPNDAFVGLACGKTSDIIVVDCDVKHGVNGVTQFLGLCGSREPSSVYQDSPSGGRHYFFRYQAGCGRNRNPLRIGGKKYAIDIKGDHGYVMFDERLGYKMHGNIQDAPPLPDWLARELSLGSDCEREGSASRWEIGKGCAIIRKADAGSRNETLNSIVFSLGRRFHGDPDAIEEIRSEAAAAAHECGLDGREILDTLDSALKSADKLGGYESEDELPSFIKQHLEEMDREADEAAEKAVEDLPDGVLPPPPVHILDQISPRIRWILESVAEAKQTTVEMTLCVFLSLVSACLGRARGVIYSEEHHWREVANLYFLLIAESGEGKSHVHSFFFEALKKLEDTQKELWATGQAAYEEEYANWKKEKVKAGEKGSPAPKRPKNTQYLLDDATIEAAVERLKDNPRGLFWAIDEFNGFFKSLDRYSKNGAGEGKRKLISAFDSGRISMTRKSQNGVSNECHLPNATIGMCGNIQPELLEKVFTADDFNQGWPQRFLYTRSIRLSPPTYPLPKLDPQISDLLWLLTMKLVNLSMDPAGKGERSVTKWLKLDPDAKKVIDDYFNELSQQTFYTSFKSYAQKLKSMTLRMALILHYMGFAISDGGFDENTGLLKKNYDAEQYIGAKTAEAAVQIMRWFAEHSAQVAALFNPALRGGKKGTAMTSSGEALIIALSRMVVEHADDIVSMGHSVDNQTYKTWLKQHGIRASAQILLDPEKVLKIETWRNARTRGRTISVESINRAQAKLTPIDAFSEKHGIEMDFDGENKELLQVRARKLMTQKPSGEELRAYRQFDTSLKLFEPENIHLPTHIPTPEDMAARLYDDMQKSLGIGPYAEKKDGEKTENTADQTVSPAEQTGSAADSATEQTKVAAETAPVVEAPASETAANTVIEAVETKAEEPVSVTKLIAQNSTVSETPAEDSVSSVEEPAANTEKALAEPETPVVSEIQNPYAGLDLKTIMRQRYNIANDDDWDAAVRSSDMPAFGEFNREVVETCALCAKMEQKGESFAFYQNSLEVIDLSLERYGLLGEGTLSSVDKSVKLAENIRPIQALPAGGNFAPCPAIWTGEIITARETESPKTEAVQREEIRFPKTKIVLKGKRGKYPKKIFNNNLPVPVTYYYEIWGGAIRMKRVEKNRMELATPAWDNEFDMPVLAYKEAPYGPGPNDPKHISEIYAEMNLEAITELVPGKMAENIRPAGLSSNYFLTAQAELPASDNPVKKQLEFMNRAIDIEAFNRFEAERSAYLLENGFCPCPNEEIAKLMANIGDVLEATSGCFDAFDPELSKIWDKEVDIFPTEESWKPQETIIPVGWMATEGRKIWDSFDKEKQGNPDGSFDPEKIRKAREKAESIKKPIPLGPSQNDLLPDLPKSEKPMDDTPEGRKTRALPKILGTRKPAKNPVRADRNFRLGGSEDMSPRLDDYDNWEFYDYD